MATDSESVIIQDPDILSGQPVFRGTRVPFQALLDYLEGEIRWVNSWNSTPVSPGSRRSAL